jgi:hypothetical protein
MIKEDLSSSSKAQTNADIQTSVADNPQIYKLIYQLRYRVSIEEMKKNIPADHDNNSLYDDLDKYSTILYAAAADNIPIATVRVTWGNKNNSIYFKQYSLDRFSDFPYESLSFTSKLVIAPNWRNSNVLSLLAYHLYKLLHEKNVEFNFCHCKPEIVGIYERLGYRRYMPAFIDPNLGQQISLVLLVNDTSHLKKTRSAFWKIARKANNSSTSAIEWFNTIT